MAQFSSDRGAGQFAIDDLAAQRLGVDAATVVADLDRKHPGVMPGLQRHASRLRLAGRPSLLGLLDGVIDIYMPDVKFSSSEVAGRLCNATDYPDVVKAALKEMHCQVGDLRMDSHGIAKRGLLIRHLVMPNGLAGTEDLMRFIVEQLSPHSYVNIMAQYRPVHQARAFSDVNRPINMEEFREALEIARTCGIHRGFE